ncbi:MAG: hypothetical protein ACJAVV_000621 [Alphaproteobacteria bacterium]|jgi:hypothetical protein
MGSTPSSGNFSVLRHGFGFSRGKVPSFSDNTQTAQVSVLQHMNDMKNPHFHINVIRVGDLPPAATARDAVRELIDYAIFRSRTIYRAVGIGVGRINYAFISSDDAGSYTNINSNDEARDLWEDWGASGNGIDAFIVQSISGFLGLSPVGGDCENGSKDDGCLAGDLTRSKEGLAKTFAHEIGHFLGRSHNHGNGTCPSSTNGQNNLMAQTGCAVDRFSEAGLRAATRLTQSQGNTMKGHCSMKNGCNL